MKWLLTIPINSRKALLSRLLSVVIAKLTYASSAWWGFATTTDRQRLQAFIRRSHRSRFVSPSLPPLDELCRASGDKLFASITSNRESVASQNYNLRPNFLIKLVISQTAILCSACYFSKPTGVLFSFYFIHLFISHPRILLNIVLSAFWQSLIKYMMMMMIVKL